MYNCNDIEKSFLRSSFDPTLQIEVVTCQPCGEEKSQQHISPVSSLWEGGVLSFTLLEGAGRKMGKRNHAIMALHHLAFIVHSQKPAMLSHAQWAKVKQKSLETFLVCFLKHYCGIQTSQSSSMLHSRSFNAENKFYIRDRNGRQEHQQCYFGRQ